MGKQRAALVLIVLLLVLILGWWKLEMIVPTSPVQPVATTNAATTTPSATTASLPTMILVHHSVVSGADVYSGSIPGIGACTEVSSGMSASGQNPAHIILLLTLAAQGNCASSATSTAADFSVSFQSTDSKAPVLNGVSLNGTAITYTLTETK